MLAVHLSGSLTRNNSAVWSRCASPLFVFAVRLLGLVTWCIAACVLAGRSPGCAAAVGWAERLWWFENPAAETPQGDRTSAVCSRGASPLFLLSGRLCVVVMRGIGSFFPKRFLSWGFKTLFASASSCQCKPLNFFAGWAMSAQSRSAEILGAHKIWTELDFPRAPIYNGDFSE